MFVFICFVECKEEIDDICENMEKEREEMNIEVGKVRVFLVRHSNVSFWRRLLGRGFWTHHCLPDEPANFIICFATLKLTPRNDMCNCCQEIEIT